MTRRAPVYRWTFDATTLTRQAVRVGEVTQEAQRWEFVFHPDYLARGRDAWELDPSFIRIKQRSAFTRVGIVPPPVFCDLALSGWSLDVLQKDSARALGPQTAAGAEPWGWWERLLHAPADGFGALFVGNLDDKPDVAPVLQAALGAVTQDTLAKAALESSSGAMGGERPKFAAYSMDPRLTEGPALAPVPVLLKFPSPSERLDSVVAEATALTLAQGLGIRVPRHHVQLFNDVPALCIARFDRGPGLAGPVHHCVSAATALDLTPGTDVDDPRRSYVRLRSRLKLPGDALELFRRIVLNAAVGNADDHPWNTSLRQTGLSTWELSPLYDVLPSFSRSGCPVFRMAITRSRSRLATPANLVAAGLQISGLDPHQVRRIIDDTHSHVRAGWRAAFETHGGGIAAARPDDWAGVFEHEWLGI
jgi:serine/threonine-protein kinase HipA